MIETMLRKYMQPIIKDAAEEAYKKGAEDTIRRFAFVYDTIGQKAKEDAYAEAGAIPIEELDHLMEADHLSDVICHKLMALPSADAVQGEWIDVENEPYCECSVCGAYIDNLDDDYAFCPRCGARMKGGDTE